MNWAIRGGLGCIGISEPLAGLGHFFPRIPRIPRLSLAAVAISAALGNDALKLDLGIVTKVAQQTQLKPGGLEVVLHLRPVFVSQLAHRF